MRRTLSACCARAVIGIAAAPPRSVMKSRRLAIELVNSAFEALVDHLHPDIHPEIRIIKDMAAGSVLLSAAGAVIVGLLFLASQYWG